MNHLVEPIGSWEATVEREIKTIETDPNHPVIGKRFRGWDGKDYLCDSWQENAGYWMTDLADETNRKNVSERAIGRTFHFSLEAASGLDVGATSVAP